MKKLLLIFFCFNTIFAFSKKSPKDFRFGDIQIEEFSAFYEKDSTASAIVLNEFGYSRFDFETGDLKYTYHARIRCRSLR